MVEGIILENDNIILQFTSGKEIKYPLSIFIKTLTNPVMSDVSITGDIIWAAGTSAPVNAVASSLTTKLTGTDNDLVFTANTKGVIGDDITIEYLVPTIDEQSDAIVVVDKAIVIQLKGDTDGGKATATIGSGSNGVVTITAADGGTYANDYTAVVENGVGISQKLAAVFEDDVLTVTLSTDDKGDPDDAKNTATLVAAAIADLDEFTATASGIGETTVGVTVTPSEFENGTNPSILTKASDIITLVEEDDDADALVSVALSGEDTGDGVVTVLAETNLDNGVNGTVGMNGTMYYYSGYIYICTATNTISGDNWRRRSLGDVY